MSIIIIGVDCATQPKNVGLARGVFNGKRLIVGQVCVNRPLVETISGWLPTDGTKTVLALDAPLGWPLALGKALVQHQAGAKLAREPNALFRRETDRFIKEMVGKQSLDVGADRIARTAHAALKLLTNLSNALQQPVPLAWTPSNLPSYSALEVYPAATLKVLFGAERVPSYKGVGKENGRLAILNRLQGELVLPSDLTLPQENDDALDATIAVLAAADFLKNKSMPPSNLALAQKEGWMWVRKPNKR